LKKIVFEDRRVSIDDMREALAADWEGHEALRQTALNGVPKYGNDDACADAVAEAVAAHFIREVLRHENPRGGRYYPGIFTFGHVTHGQRTGASPDGRKAGDTITAHITPAVGTDRTGPTAVVNSAARVCRLQPPEGTALDIRLHPSAVSGKSGRLKLRALIETFMEQGGIQVQLNVVDTETLRRAQRNPDDYRGLIVRVWGFSAYFVQLTRDYQEEIIARTEHGL
jgi:formate C-acetyltransferase